MIFNIHATNINDARRETRCYEKAITMGTQGYTVTEVTDGPSVAEYGMFYQVTTPEGNVYGVDPHLQKCTCPDFDKNGHFCKHMIFINLWAEREPESVQGLRAHRRELDR